MGGHSSRWEDGHRGGAHLMDPSHRGKMNLNAAPERELTQLPRIGADKARRIGRYRAVRRGFRDWADFAGTPGLTAEDVEAIRARAWIGPAPEGAWPAADRRRTSRAATGWGASALNARRQARARRSATGRDSAVRRPAGKTASPPGPDGPRPAARGGRFERTRHPPPARGAGGRRSGPGGRTRRRTRRRSCSPAGSRSRSRSPPSRRRILGASAQD